jgi:hypothetical protein
LFVLDGCVLVLLQHDVVLGIVYLSPVYFFAMVRFGKMGEAAQGRKEANLEVLL